MLRKMLAGLAMMAVVGCLGGTARASVAFYDNRAAFNAQGPIVENYGFEDFTGSVSYDPGSPWTSHGITYAATQNTIIAPTYVYGTGPEPDYLPLLFGNTSNFFASNYDSLIPGTIEYRDLGQYYMLGFDLAGVLNSDPVAVTVNTNQGSYTDTLTVTDVSVGMTFYGFVATGVDEYITDFTLNGTGGVSPALDNVTLGAVPEPSTYLLLCLSLGAVGYARRRMTKVTPK